MSTLQIILFDTLARHARRQSAAAGCRQQMAPATLEEEARQADRENKQTIENKEIPPTMVEDLDLEEL